MSAAAQRREVLDAERTADEEAWGACDWVIECPGCARSIGLAREPSEGAVMLCAACGRQFEVVS